MPVNTAPPLGPTPRAGSPRLYLREEELDAGLAMVFDAAAALKAASEPARIRHGLSWADARALSAARTPDTVLSMAARLAVAKQTLTKTLDGLEARGFLTRTPDPRDGRRRVIRQTDAGARVDLAVGDAMRARLANAYRAAGGDAVAGCDLVLQALGGAVPGRDGRAAG